MKGYSSSLLVNCAIKKVVRRHPSVEIWHSLDYWDLPESRQFLRDLRRVSRGCQVFWLFPWRVDAEEIGQRRWRDQDIVFLWSIGRAAIERTRFQRFRGKCLQDVYERWVSHLKLSACNIFNCWTTRMVLYWLKRVFQHPFLSTTLKAPVPAHLCETKKKTARKPARPENWVHQLARERVCFVLLSSPS